MARCREYIGAHLHEEITAATLADRFGYSFYHFCHVFKSCNEMAVGEYLHAARLSRAAAEIANGGSVTDAAMASGFDTPSGFNRAFRRRFGMNPTEYSKLNGGKITTTPEIKKLAAFTAVGYSLAPPEGELDILDNGADWLGKDFIPDGMVALDIPAAKYAVFAVPKADSAAGLSENFKKTWKFIFSDWFDGSGYKFDHKAMDFEYYIGEDTFIYVPVLKK